MTVSSSQKEQYVQYSAKTSNRAQIALFCSPFCLNLLKTMRNQSVPLPLIAGARGLEQGYTKKLLGEGRVERELMWLIRVGLLRREVDGQGITDSFRLTPLGRQILEKWENQVDVPTPSLKDRLLNFLIRWLPISL